MINPLRPVKAVLFDVGHTLLFPDTGFLYQLAQKYHSKLSQSEFEKIGWQCKHAAYAREPGNPFKIWLESWFEKAGVSPPDLEHVFDGVLAEHEREHLWRIPEPSLPEILQTLRMKNFILGVISNSDGSVQHLLTKHRLEFYFKVILDSHEIGIEKPDAKIFLQALDALHIKPEHAVYIGDHYLFDVQGAQNAGLQAILFDASGQMAKRADCHVITELRVLAEMLERYNG